MPSESPIRAVAKGLSELQAELNAMDARIDVATLAGLKASQNVAKARIKAGMRGRPRWDRRGVTGRNGGEPAVNLNLTPHHVTKSGGPGRLTGHLSGAVGGVKRPKKVRRQYVGGVGVGGPLSITNLYRAKVNSKYPFIEPGVRKAEPKIAEAYKKAWAKATET